ncbi:MAG: UDP-N-acetylmuramoyl-L-alanine--D-glutamate ligase, partial [Bacteroidales bacterium]|nr:UDP-N-acetylmuramoyl-L-alanine--D-glutamate ligase [Bacteroidales bacterium]
MNAKFSIETLAKQGTVSRSMAESVATHIRDLRKKVIQESFQDFRQVDHRLEFVAKVRGVEYIDDAKASNVNSTWFALENMTRPVVWIAGGKTDDIDFSSMRN